MTQTSWRNWAGNQQFTCEEVTSADSLESIVEAVANATNGGRQLRVAGSGHSWTPIVESTGTVLSLSGYSGLVSVDEHRQRARFRAGTRLSTAGKELWDQGFSIANQGDLDHQTLAGAISTGTKGSGVNFGTMSSQVSAVNVVRADGTTLEVDSSSPELLSAAQVSLGMLGVIHEVELDVLPRYFLRESNSIMPFEQLLDEWDALVTAHRHFSFWWMPTDRSAAVYELPEVAQDHAFVKILDEESAPDELTVVGEPGSRLGRSYLVYPDLDAPTSPSYELEYVVEAARGREAFLHLRDMMLNGYPGQASPVQIRWQKADGAYLSPQYHRDSVSVSVSGITGTNWEPFLKDVDSELDAMDARPHWGKMNYLKASRLRQIYPRAEQFLAIREQMDPSGTFFSTPLQELFASDN